MIYILFSTLCSVAVSVILKLAPRWHVDLRQAVAGNYLVAALLCAILLNPSPSLLITAPSITAVIILVALGVLLPSIFLVLAKSVQLVGVVRTDAAQRISLLIPLMAAFTLFGEALTWQKVLGLGIGLLAILCIVARQEDATTNAEGNTTWYWLAGVFVGMGVIDILFKQMAQLTEVPFPDVLLATFVLALMLSVLYLSGLFAKKRAAWGWQNVVGALLIGSFNFGNILLYIMAHRQLAHSPALVFSAMNIGVIVLATLVGVWLLKEQLNWLNRTGILLAIIAVAVLATQV